MGAAVIAHRQLDDVLEIFGQHPLAAAMRQPVGIERHGGVADDGEETESHPGRQQRGEVGPLGTRAAALGAG
jgi:hypothetical protein